MFSNMENFSKQGDIGEARAIYEYTKLGYTVSRTLFDSAKYDLIVDKGSLVRVQVKTASFIKDSCFIVYLQQSAVRYRRPRDERDYDELFVLCKNGDYYMIPTDVFNAKVGLALNDRFDIYKNI